MEATIEQRSDELPCTCTPETTPGSYAVGCPRHTAEAAAAPAQAWPNVETFTVTYYRASVKIATPVLRDDEVWSQQSSVTCDHLHESREAAERCSLRLARKNVGAANVWER